MVLENNKKLIASKDEMNLVEFPFALLSNRHPQNSSKTLTFSDEIKGPSNSKIQRQWIVTGSDIHGLPLSMDEELLMGILYLGHLSSFEGPEVYFIKKQVLDILKWGTNKQYYNRLEMGLARLKGVSIFAKNAFWDNATKSYTTIGFGIISDFLLKNDGKGRKSNSLNKEEMSTVTLDKYIYRSIKSGYIKTLDFSFWVDLDTSVSKRLYRYLDKKFFRDNFFEINIDKLCHEKLGLSRNIKYRSSLMQKIEYGLKELIHKGYLKKYNLKGNIIQFIRNEKFSRNIIQTRTNTDFFQHSSIIGEMKAIGFEENSCYAMIRKDPDKIREAIDIYYREKNRRFESGKDAIDNPIAYIRSVYNNISSDKIILSPNETKKIEPSMEKTNSENALLIWEKVKESIFSRSGDSEAVEWLTPLETVELSHNELSIRVPNETYKSFIEKTYLKDLSDSVRKVDPNISIKLIA